MPSTSCTHRALADARLSAAGLAAVPMSHLLSSVRRFSLAGSGAPTVRRLTRAGMGRRQYGLGFHSDARADAVDGGRPGDPLRPGSRKAALPFVFVLVAPVDADAALRTGQAAGDGGIPQRDEDVVVPSIRRDRMIAVCRSRRYDAEQRVPRSIDDAQGRRELPARIDIVSRGQIIIAVAAVEPHLVRPAHPEDALHNVDASGKLAPA